MLQFEPKSDKKEKKQNDRYLLAAQGAGAVLLEPGRDALLVEEVVARQYGGALAEGEVLLAHAAQLRVRVGQVPCLDGNHREVAGGHGEGPVPERRGGRMRLGGATIFLEVPSQAPGVFQRQGLKTKRCGHKTLKTRKGQMFLFK